MDLSTACSILTKLIGHLLLGNWWLIHQKEANDIGLAKASSLPRAKINALLINDGTGKETTKGFGIMKSQ